jgi:hypothetical protein
MSTVRLTHKYQGVELDVPEGTDYLAFFDREYPKWVAAVERVVANTATAQTVTNTVSKVFDAPKPQASDDMMCKVCGTKKSISKKTGNPFCYPCYMKKIGKA